MSSMYGSSGSRSPTGKVAGYKVGQMQNYTPEQMNLFRSLFSNVGPDSYLSRLSQGDEGLFSEMEEPALRQFSGIQGNLASRFSGMGMGARKSSGFQNTSNQAASDFAGDLQSRRQELQRQAIKDLMGLSSDLLDKRPNEQFLYEKKKPFWQQLLGGAAPIGGALVGGLLGGPAGAAIGGRAGASAGQAFY